MSALIAALHAAAVSKRAFWTVAGIGFVYSSVVVADRYWFEARDEMTYFATVGAMTCFAFAAWWWLAEWRRGR